VFLYGALECFHWTFDSINQLIVSLDRH
jgi:hypothetical protein